MGQLVPVQRFGRVMIGAIGPKFSAELQLFVLLLVHEAVPAQRQVQLRAFQRIERSCRGLWCCNTDSSPHMSHSEIETKEAQAAGDNHCAGVEPGRPLRISYDTQRLTFVN